MSLSKFQTLSKVKPAVFASVYATLDEGTKSSVDTVLDLAQRLQHASEEPTDKPTKAKKRPLFEMKQTNVNTAIVAVIEKFSEDPNSGMCVFFLFAL